ncbi:MAG: CehA/McbA family metallohydrolase [Verrucomicrobia bacterium]|nr:CehA/McbA family metallohydrolase [Verrucomicrobiota bacterium]
MRSNSESDSFGVTLLHPITRLRQAATILVVLASCIALDTFGGEASKLTASQRSAFGGVFPRLSPDGGQIAVSYQGSICTIPIQGGKLSRLSRGEGLDIEPAWSPDGETLAFVNSSGFFGGQLGLIRAGDGSPVQLRNPARAQGPLFFHPNGRRLLGRFGASGSQLKVSWYDLESGEIQPISIQNLNSRSGIGSYALSNDGDWIVLVSSQDVPGEQGGNDGPQADVWRIPSGGGEALRLFQHPARIYNLCWDAKDQGLFVSTDLGVSHNDLWHLPLNDPLRAARKLTFGQADEDWPSTSRGGGLLVHTENPAGATSLIRMDTETGATSPVVVEDVDFREPTASLRIQVVDRESGSPTVAKVFVKLVNGKFHAPMGALYRVTGGLSHFYLRGETEFSVPAGKYEIIVMRGLEYRVHRSELELKGGDRRTHSISLERWTDSYGSGWFSGENHIHANYGYGAWYNTPSSVLDQCEGEDLNVCNIMVANSDGNGVFDREFFRGRPDGYSGSRTILYWNQEFRSTIWGHMTLVNLPQLVEPIFTGFKDTTNPWDVPTNADIAERTRQAQGLASYTHPASNTRDPYTGAYSAKGLPVDAALGRIDALDVMGHGYDASLPLWYRLLNCGFHIPISAGTDCFLNRIPSLPPGWGRAYVRLNTGLSYRGWVEGLRAGRSFVSNGPMIEFHVGESGAGDAIQLDQPGSIRVRAKAWAQFPLEQLEIVYNGNVVGTGTVADDNLSASFDATLPLENSGWLAARTAGPIVPFFVGSRFNAHTSPVYIVLKNRPLHAKADAEYFLEWIDRLEVALKQRDRIPVRKDHVELQLRTARSVYRKIAGPEAK